MHPSAIVLTQEFGKARKNGRLRRVGLRDVSEAKGV
jgi:hypothetical protein